MDIENLRCFHQRTGNIYFSLLRWLQSERFFFSAFIRNTAGN